MILIPQTPEAGGQIWLTRESMQEALEYANTYLRQEARGYSPHGPCTFCFFRVGQEIEVELEDIEIPLPPIKQKGYCLRQSDREQIAVYIEGHKAVTYCALLYHFAVKDVGESIDTLINHPWFSHNEDATITLSEEGKNRRLQSC